MAYNILAGGTCLQDIELLRNNEAWLNALDAEIIPDPTTAGDFLRRFSKEDIITGNLSNEPQHNRQYSKKHQDSCVCLMEIGDTK